MTNKEYLTKFLAGLNISDDDIDVICAKAGIDPDATCESTRTCDMAVYQRMSVVLKGVMQNVTEGGYSISWNIEAVKWFYKSLCNELDVEDVLVGRPKVRNKSYMW